MTPAERGILEEACHEGAKNPVKQSELGLGIGWTLGAMLCGVALFAVVALQKNQALMFVAAPVLVIAGIVLFFLGANMVLGFFRWRGYAKQFHRNVNPKVRDALAAGLVEVKRVEVKEAIEIEEFEDEGSGWIFDIGEGQCLVLKGQSYFPDDKQSAWPNTSFEIVRTAKHGLWVGIFCFGNALKPLQTVPTSEFPEEFIWGEMESVQQGSLLEVLNNLRTGGAGNTANP